MRPRRALAMLCALAAAACESSPGTVSPPATTAKDASVAQPREVDETVVPKRRSAEPNPLGLPAANVTFTEGQFVYAVPEAMLTTAKVGVSLELRAAKVESMDGHDVIVHAASGPAYNIHAGYVVAPRMKPVQRGTRVMVPYRAQLRHATVQRQVKNQIVVRYGDVGVALGDQAIAIDEVGVLGGGLEPGAYALARHEHGQHLVLLVSLGMHADGARRWLVLGPEGEARILDADELTPLGDARKLKPGSSVLVAWHGDMVPATLRTIEPSGLVSVKRPRVGPTLIVGIDMIAPAPATTPPTP